LSASSGRVAGELLLEGRELSAWRGESLLFDALDVSIVAGEVLQLAGPNGSGKSTLLRALIGLSELDEGEVMWRGKPILRQRDTFHAELLYLGHKPGINGALNPLENLRALVGDPPRMPDPVAAGTTSTALDAHGEALLELGLGSRLDIPCRALSAGQQRRVALARLRLQSRTLWLLDEPLTALDSAGHEWVRRCIVERAATGGAVIYTTHQKLALEGVTTRVLELSEAA